MFAGPPSHRIAGGVFVALLLLACATDLRSRRIPNVLVLVIAAAGVAWAFASRPPLPAAQLAFGGLGTGLALWFPLFALHVMGAGDVKLFAAAATWLGARSALEASLLAALFGGALALLYLLSRSGVAGTALRLGGALRDPTLLRQEGGAERDASAARRMPYALAMAAGLVTAALAPGVLLG